MQALFAGALTLVPEERVAFLDRLCDEDPDIRREVLSLLEADTHSPDFLERSVPETLTDHRAQDDRPEP